MRFGAPAPADQSRTSSPHCFVRELFECGYRQLDVLLPCVLNLVVTDAAKALDEHHDGGDSGARDFSSIVDRPGWQAVHRPAGFAGCFVTEGRQPSVKKDGVYPKEAFPSYDNIAFRGKASAGIFCIPQHSQKGFIVEMALIKVVRHSSTTLVGMPGAVVQAPIVHTPPWRSAMR
jgi:hypothetical protein